MIDDLNNVILAEMVIIGLCVFIQNSWPRRIVAFVFAFTILAHDWAFHTILNDLFYYYITAGSLDLLVILIVSNMSHVPRLGIDIQLVAIASMGYNLVGFTLHMLEETGIYQPEAAQVYSELGSLLYGSLFVVLYVYAILALVIMESKDAGSYEMDSWISLFRFDNHQGDPALNGNQG